MQPLLSAQRQVSQPPFPCELNMIHNMSYSYQHNRLPSLLNQWIIFFKQGRAFSVDSKKYFEVSNINSSSMTEQDYTGFLIMDSFSSWRCLSSLAQPARERPYSWYSSCHQLSRAVSSCCLMIASERERDGGEQPIIMWNRAAFETNICILVLF